VGQPLLKEPHTKAQRHEEKKDGTRERGRLVSKHNMLQIRSDYLLITLDFPRKDRQQVKTVINPRRGNHGKTKNIHERI
jgi:hypothetical protein